MQRIESPKNLPKAMLFVSDSGRYVRVYREKVEKKSDYYVLHIQAFEVDENDNLKDTIEGNSSRTPKTPHVVYRSEILGATKTLFAGWVKVTPPTDQVYSDENLPAGAIAVDELPESAEDGALRWVSAQDQLWKFDAEGELGRVCRMKAEEAERGWISLEQEDLDL